MVQESFDTLLGRFLKLFGNRIGLDECEHILRSAVTCDCACTGTDEKMIVYITDEAMSHAALEAILNATKLPATVVEVRAIDALPKNEAGKILYAKLPKE